MADLAQAILSGLGTGAVYALIAFGITLVYATSRTLNFAHGEVATVGVFAALTIVYVGFPPWQGIIVGIAVAALLGIVVRLVVFAPGERAGASDAWLLGTLVAAGAIANGAAVAFGARTYGTEQLGIGTALGADSVLRLGDTAVASIFVWLALAGLSIAAALDIMLRKTSFGRAVRAIAHDARTASLCGIDVPRTATRSFALASALGAAGAILYTPLTFVSTGLGQFFTFKGLAAAVVGGLGSARGALAGGLALGVAEQVAALWLRAGYRDAVSLGLLIAVLVVRPAGLFGTPVVERR